MTTKPIADYLTKQLYIEKNIVTYRSLSRQFSIHVNEAKNELATYHHDAPYQGQKCAATFFLSGIPRRGYDNGHDEDVDMDRVLNPSEEEEDEDGEEVPETQITIVNERDLEVAKISYAEISDIHVYSISPAPVHDAGLLCAPTEFVRNTDREKGPAFSLKLGRLAGKSIKRGASKKKPQPIAGPSKLKIPEPKAAVKTESKEAISNAATDKGKEKPKATGKLQFFSKPKEPVKAVKKEDSIADTKKMFFSKPAPAAAKAAATTKDAAATKKEPVAVKVEQVEPSIVKIGPPRGVKRKSSIGLERRDKSPANPATTSTPAESNVARVRGRIVVSDDESDAPVVKPTRRKPRVSDKTESTGNSEAEREAMALMDIDDDEVERVSRVPSTRASSNERDDIDDGDAASSGVQDEDVSMEDDVPVKAKPKQRKPKNVIPVGRNGLKKRKVTKTRRTMDASGYMRKEDYSDWESVEEGDEPAPEPVKAKGKAKAKVAAVKKEEEESQKTTPPPPPPVKEKTKEKEPAAAKKAPAKPPATKAKSGKGVPIKGKQQTLNFFGPKTT